MPQVSTSLNDGLLRALEARAKRENRSVSNLIAYLTELGFNVDGKIQAVVVDKRKDTIAA